MKVASEAVLVRNADRMMTSARAKEKGIALEFADGATGVLPYSALPEVGDLSNLQSIELPNPYEMVLKTVEGAVEEVPWDYARHYCDPSYEPRVQERAHEGRIALGHRVRSLRVATSFTQSGLASKAGISRVTLVRLEAGEQSPRYETLVALANALGRPASDLLSHAEPE